MMVTKKKRVKIILLALMFCFVSLGIGFISPKTAHAGSTTYSNSGGVITVENGLIELKWNSSNGQLIGLKNMTTNMQHIGGSVYGNWTIFVNDETSDMWEASLGDMYKGRDETLNYVAPIMLANGILVHMEYYFVGLKNITVKQDIAVLNDDPVSYWSTEVVNNASGTVVTAVVSPQITGVQTLSNEKLLWPYKEGQIITDPGEDLQYMQYPVPASMQWMYLYNSSEALYYAALDEDASFKEFRFGYDENLDYDASSPRQMSVTNWPFVEPSNSWQSYTVEIGVVSEGDWYWGADRYRDWLINDAGWAKWHPDMVEDLSSWRTAINLNAAGTKIHDYDELPGLIDDVDDEGIDVMEVIGWHEDAFDSLYPDYEYIEDSGGAEYLGYAIDDIHTQGDLVFFYINNHIADVESVWSASHEEDCEYIDADGNGYTEYYNDNTFKAMCPMAEDWIDQLKTVAMDLRDMGADGIWWDQMMEMDAVLCYSDDVYGHGHSTPATAQAEGYKKMMDTIHYAFSYSGSDQNYIFAAEGVNDYYSKYVDICGMMWQRPFGFDEWAGDHAPQITRYTIPARFLGLPTIDKTSTDKDQYAWAFLMGDILLADMPDDVSPNSNVFPGYIDIYEEEEEIYKTGTYKDEKGLTLSNSYVKGTIIVGENEDCFGVQLWNTDSSDHSVTVTVNYDEIGLSGEAIASVADIEGGSISFSDVSDTLTFIISSPDIPANDVMAIKVTLS